MQCVQIFRPQKAQEKCKNRKKKRQPYISKLLLLFWLFCTFQEWFIFGNYFSFCEFFLNKVNFYYTKRLKNQKALLIFVFVLCANCKNHGAKEGQKAPLLREIARPGHIASMNFFLLSSLYLVCAAPHVCILAVND